jgi:heme ABC exporter ATP-binding subunit CcmA
VPAANPISESSKAPGIIFENAEKRFGSLVALRRLSLEIASGEFVVLVGPNGSGKTTLLRLSALLSRPTGGKVTVGNSDGAAQADVKSKIGMVGHATMVYDELTAEENLTFFARLYNLSDPRRRATEALEPAGLADRAGDLVRTFSRGMRQRLAIARALLAGPTLLLLDEPAAGLDRDGAAWLAGTLVRLRSAGATVLMSSHGQSESLTLATRAIEMRGGTVVADSGAGGDLGSIIERGAGAHSSESSTAGQR